MTTHRFPLAPLLGLASGLILVSCAGEPEPTPQDQFWTALSSHCGNAYPGELVSNDAADTDFQAAEMVMHVRECSDTQIKVPFHIRQTDGSWDRSRTWVLTRTGTGLRLKHDHRHDDGMPDEVTMYGGDTADQGTARQQDFPVDDESIALFERTSLTASVTNVWTVEVDPKGTEGATFAYQLQRTVDGGAPEDRFFRVEFDVTDPVEIPPAPWGHDAPAG